MLIRVHWLFPADIAVFRFINDTLSNPFFDRVMPWVSGNSLFGPAAVVAAMWLIWKHRSRGVACLCLLGLTVGVTDGLVCRSLKHGVARPRPFAYLDEVRRPAQVNANGEMRARNRELLGNGPSNGNLASFPSAHAANTTAAAVVLFICFRRSLRFTLPVAALVSFSRVYNGVHHPSDVLAGAMIGAGAAAAVVWSAEFLWRRAGRRWFPLWWAALPTLIGAGPSLPGGANKTVEEPLLETPSEPPDPEIVDAQWVRLGYVVIAVLFVVRLFYLASGTIELSEDEAYQWLWSKHLDWSYYSKPPLIAYTQFLGTAIWSDTELGVRFFSPVIALILSVLVLRFFAKEVNARAGFFLVLILATTPLLAVGATIMTVDPLLVLFWTLAMLSGWRAIKANGTNWDWAQTGIWMGLGFLSKYTELLQLLCWVLFFVLWPGARHHLRRPGPYIAFAILLIAAVPVLVWNGQHSWITVRHVAGNADLDKAWRPALKYLGEFLGAEFGLLNPWFFLATVWAAIAFWRRQRHDPRLVYFFSMGAPVFVGYLLWTFHSRVMANWIAVSVLPMFCVMAIYWDTQWRLGRGRFCSVWLASGLAVGAIIVVTFHNTDLVRGVTKHYLPVDLDPLGRVRNWSATAAEIGEARQQLLEEGKPVFIICGHYGLAGQTSFYLPAAKAGVPQDPLVYCQTSPRPQNQFYFWPGYTERKGQNAIFVRELDRRKPEPKPPPPGLVAEFDSVEPLDVRTINYHGNPARFLQFFACRGLK